MRKCFTYLVCLVSLNTKRRISQYKLIYDNKSNKMLFEFGKGSSPLYSFCKTNDESPIHYFFECTKMLFHKMQSICSECHTGNI